MNFLKNHPFPVEAFFESSVVSIFAAPKAQVQPLIPECLELGQPADDAGAFLFSCVGSFFGGTALSAVCTSVGDNTLGEGNLSGTGDILGGEIAGAVFWIFPDKLAGEGL